MRVFMKKILIGIILLLNIFKFGFCQKLGDDIFEFNEKFGKPTPPMFEYKGISAGYTFKDGFLRATTLQDKVMDLEFNYRKTKITFQDEIIEEYQNYLPDDSKLIEKTDVSKGEVKGIAYIYQSKELQEIFQQSVKSRNIIIEIFYNITLNELIEVNIKCYPRKKDICNPIVDTNAHNLNIRIQKDKEYKKKQAIKKQKLEKKEDKDVQKIIYEDLLSNNFSQPKLSKEELEADKFKEKADKLIMETFSYSLQRTDLLPVQVDKYNTLIHEIESANNSLPERKHTINYLKLNLGNLFLELKDYNKALELYMLAIEDKENYQNHNGYDGAATCYYFLSKNLLKNGKYKKALEYINKALKVNSYFMEFFLLRSEIYQKLGHTNESESDKNTVNRLSKMKIDIPQYFKEYILKIKK